MSAWKTGFSAGIVFAAVSVTVAAQPRVKAPQPRTPKAVMKPLRCRTIDLTQSGGSMEKVSIRSQLGERICAAETIAVLGDAWRFKHNPASGAREASGIELMFRYALKNAFVHPTRKGGLAELMVEIALSEGYCDRQWFRERFEAISDKYIAMDGFTPEQTPEFLEHARRYPDVYYFHFWELLFEKSSRQSLESDLATLTPDACKPKRFEIESAIVAWKNKRLTEFMKHARLLECPREHRIAFSTPKPARWFENFIYEVPGSATQTQLLNDKAPETIAEMLGSGMPVVASYCQRSMEQGHAWRPRTDPSGFLDDIEGCEPHSAVIVGSRPAEDGSCEYKIRPGAGPICSKVSKDLKCDPETGEVWMGEALLRRSLMDVLTLKPASESRSRSLR